MIQELVRVDRPRGKGLDQKRREARDGTDSSLPGDQVLEGGVEERREDTAKGSRRKMEYMGQRVWKTVTTPIVGESRGGKASHIGK
jgi:hypothetical protein